MDDKYTIRRDSYVPVSYCEDLTGCKCKYIMREVDVGSGLHKLPTINLSKFSGRPKFVFDLSL